MEILELLLQMLKAVPWWVYAIALICIFAPTITYLVKRSFKVAAIVVCIAAVLFICPSVISSFMNAAGLTYNEETGELTNSAGQTITLRLPDGTSIDVNVQEDDTTSVPDNSGATDPDTSTDDTPNTNNVLTTESIFEKVQFVLSNFDLDEVLSADFTALDLQAKLVEFTGESIDLNEAATVLETLKNIFSSIPTDPGSNDSTEVQ